MTQTPITPPDISGDEQAIGNRQRILDHRINQSEHLREIAARNGNEHLLDTADRMAANATTNYERQQQRITGIPTDPATPPATDSVVTPAPGATDVTGPVTQAAKIQSRPSRGFWLRSR